jgi:Cellulase (glycosyl hydrolase family 5)
LVQEVACPHGLATAHGLNDFLERVPVVNHGCTGTTNLVTMTAVNSLSSGLALVATLWSVETSFTVGAVAQRTRVSIADGRWHINGEVTYRGAEAEGLLLNVRMVNVTFEDQRHLDFDAEANSDEFIARIPDYVAHGIRAFTLNLQGGMPGYEGAVNSAFNVDGSLRDSYMTRVRRVIEVCDRHGAVVILGCYYQRQDQVLKDEKAVRAGVVNVVKWIQAAGFGNVVLEIANEFGHGGFNHRILKSPEGQVELIQLARRTAPALLVSTSGLGDGASHESVARASDFLLVHLNSTRLEEIPTQIASLKRYGKPILCNEDQKLGEEGAKAAKLCVVSGASWGLMLEKLNQHFPFTFQGAADDPAVYAALKQLAAVKPASNGRAETGLDAEPLKLHPENPHYFLFRGKAAVLITAGEHYGAVLNLDFDYVRYLNELEAGGFNLTRLFSGFYRELPGSFGIEENTLAPAPGRFACPWARSETPGAADGGNKFDLERWDARYFERLKSFVNEASNRGVIVEVVLFCTMYDDALWTSCPLNARNNAQAVGKVSRSEVFALKEHALVTAQEAMVRKIVTELKDSDNVYYEICNEPYERGGFQMEWNDRIVSVIAETEASIPIRHLIAQGIANGSAAVERPNPRVSVFNFHSARPESVALNYSLNRPIADDETGGRDRTDFSFRSEAWEFMLAGGAVFSHLDFSFTCAHPDGTARFIGAPGGGGPNLRRQLRVLKEFIETFDFVRMQPDHEMIRSHRAAATDADAQEQTPPAVTAFSQPGRSYAIYVRGSAPSELTLELPAGGYLATWCNTKNGAVEKSERFKHTGGSKLLISPSYDEDIALRVNRTA